MRIEIGLEEPALLSGLRRQRGVAGVEPVADAAAISAAAEWGVGRAEAPGIALALEGLQRTRRVAQIAVRCSAQQVHLDLHCRWQASWVERLLFQHQLVLALSQICVP